MRLSPAGEALLQREEGASYSPAKPWYIMSAVCVAGRGLAVIAEGPAGEGEEGPATSLRSVRAARLSLRCRSCLCRWSIARRRPFIPCRRVNRLRHVGRTTPARGGNRSARVRLAPRARSRHRPAPPPSAGNNGTAGWRKRGGAAGRRERDGAGGEAPGFPPPRRVVQPGSGTH